MNTGRLFSKEFANKSEMFFPNCLINLKNRIGLQAKRRTKSNKMAKIDVRKMNGDESYCLNLSYSVGFPGNNGRIANMSGDIMLIQAIFRFIKIHDPSNPFSQAIQYSDLPMVNGTFDNLTWNMIRAYQQANARILLKVDGIIEPALYHHRNIDTIHKSYRVMTITALDIDCSTAALTNPTIAGGGSWSGGSGGGANRGVKIDNHIKALKYEFPQLPI